MINNRRTVVATLIRSGLKWTTATIASTMLIATCSAADQQVTTGLSYKPRQTGITYDVVSEKEAEDCTGKYETRNGFDGLVIYNANGQPLRRFADSNGDRNVDQWCYYKDGIEVYRDIDSDFNGVADQYRWLGTAGTRWGIDKNEDGKIELWKSISAEEVTIEVVEAIKSRDDERFRRLLINESELKSLGLGDDKGDVISKRISDAKKNFTEFARTQKLVTEKTKWAHFAADKPGVVPAGTEGSTQDIVAYENAIAIVENDATSQQLMVGTLVQIGTAWRLADIPRSISDGTVLSDNGLFFPAAASNRIGGATASSEQGLSPAIQSLIADLEKIDESIREGGGNLESLHERRADTLLKIIAANRGSSELGDWIRQFADSVSSAAQTGEYPKGLDQLKDLQETLEKSGAATAEIPYIAYRVLATDYSIKSIEENADFAKIQRDHMKNLETFVDTYPDSVDAAEAMIQIALNKELAGDEKGGEKWYRMVATKFAQTPQGEKASGAIARLNLEGQKFSLVGKTLDDKKVDTKAYANSPIIIHYWATWCEPCKADMLELRKMQAKYEKQNLKIVGVNLDNNPQQAIDFLKTNGKQFPWPHIYEQSGFQSDLAVKLGVLSIPVTILVDGKGNVVKRTSHFSREMVDALDSILEKQTGASPQAQAQAPAKAPPKQPPAQLPNKGNEKPSQAQNPNGPKRK